MLSQLALKIGGAVPDLLWGSITSNVLSRERGLVAGREGRNLSIHKPKNQSFHPPLQSQSCNRSSTKLSSRAPVLIPCTAYVAIGSWSIPVSMCGKANLIHTGIPPPPIASITTGMLGVHDASLCIQSANQGRDTTHFQLLRICQIQRL